MSSSGIYPALSGANAGSQAMDVLSNNMANSNSAGFRAQRLGFREALSRAQGAKGVMSPQGARIRSGDQRFVTVGDTVPDMTPGTLRQTGADTDIAISGPGFLVAKTPEGTRYLRGASLVRGPGGRLVTATGIEVLGVNDQPLVAPVGELAINARGEVRAGGQLVGALRLVEFVDPARLRAAGSGQFVAGPGMAPQEPKQSELLPGYLEGSNVSALKTMTDVIVSARHYEALHRAIETFREIDTTAARDLASVP